MPYYNRDPKSDHNFDNRPYASSGAAAFVTGSARSVLGFWVVDVTALQVLLPWDRGYFRV